jgi:hypothetical protein
VDLDTLERVDHCDGKSYPAESIVKNSKNNLCIKCRDSVGEHAQLCTGTLSMNENSIQEYDEGKTWSIWTTGKGGLHANEGNDVAVE